MEKSALKTICVFCGANAGHSPFYAEVARDLAQQIVHRGDRLIYGGGCVGLMGVLADETLRRQGYVIGVVPKFLRDYEVAHQGLHELIVTESMHERKAIMAERSDAVIALPGGFGSLDELFEILTWKQLHLHSKPVIALNVRGYYDHLAKMLEHMVEEGFLKPNNLRLIQFANSVPHAFQQLDSYRPQATDGKWIDQQLV